MKEEELLKAVEYLQRPVRISPTRTELRARCPRRHTLSDLLHLHKPDGRSHALIFGDHAHSARDVFWEHALDEDGFDHGGGAQRVLALEAAQDHLRRIWEVPDGSYHTLDLGLTLLEEYAKQAKLGGVLPGVWRMLEREERRQNPLAEALVATYKTDSLLENEEGEIAIVDMKTASQLGPKWRKSHEESVQMRCYKALEELRLGRSVGYVLIEGIQKKGAAGNVDYLWADMLWSDAYAAEGLALLLQQGLEDVMLVDSLSQEKGSVARWQEALEVALTDVSMVPFNLMDCNSYYSPCEYTELCVSCPTERVGLALADYEVSVHDY
jgi:hypothetical protein